MHTKEEIIQLATTLKQTLGSNPFEICNYYNFIVHSIKLNPNVYPAYTVNWGNGKVISINEKFTLLSQKILCAHELGHALLHDTVTFQGFNDSNPKTLLLEEEADLFAVTLLFNQNDFIVPLSKLSSYELKEILNSNISLLY